MFLVKPFSFLFMLIVWLRNRLYDFGVLKSKRLPGRVISVGNLALGGTGKSPVVAFFAREIIASSRRPAIVTRGYRSGLGSREWQVLLNGHVIAGVSRQDVIADEALMQSMMLPDTPVIVGARRFKAVRSFLRHCPQFNITHWILDDGFQHRQIARDCDVVLLDARAPFGNVIPAGKFRESISALKRATFVVITKAENATQLDSVRGAVKAVNPGCETAAIKFFAQPIKIVVGSLDPKPTRFGLVAGIAHPNDFVQFALDQGLSVHETCFTSDHGPFDPDSLRRLEAQCDAILTTEKDFARSQMHLRRLRIPVYVLPLGLEWEGKKPAF